MRRMAADGRVWLLVLAVQLTVVFLQAEGAPVDAEATTAATLAAAAGTRSEDEKATDTLGTAGPARGDSNTNSTSSSASTGTGSKDPSTGSAETGSKGPATGNKDTGSEQPSTGSAEETAEGTEKDKDTTSTEDKDTTSTDDKDTTDETSDKDGRTGTAASETGSDKNKTDESGTHVNETAGNTEHGATEDGKQRGEDGTSSDTQVTDVPTHKVTGGLKQDTVTGGEEKDAITKADPRADVTMAPADNVTGGEGGDNATLKPETGNKADVITPSPRHEQTNDDVTHKAQDSTDVAGEMSTSGSLNQATAAPHKDINGGNSTDNVTESVEKRTNNSSHGPGESEVTAAPMKKDGDDSTEVDTDGHVTESPHKDVKMVTGQSHTGVDTHTGEHHVSATDGVHDTHTKAPAGPHDDKVTGADHQTSEGHVTDGHGDQHVTLATGQDHVTESHKDNHNTTTLMHAADDDGDKMTTQHSEHQGEHKVTGTSMEENDHMTTMSPEEKKDKETTGDKDEDKDSSMTTAATENQGHTVTEGPQHVQEGDGMSTVIDEYKGDDTDLEDGSFTSADDKVHHVTAGHSGEPNGAVTAAEMNKEELSPTVVPSAEPENHQNHLTTAEPESQQGHVTTNEPENYHGHATTAEPDSHQGHMTTANAENHHGQMTTEEPKRHHGHASTAEPENDHGHVTTKEQQSHHGHVTTAEPENHHGHMTTAEPENHHGHTTTEESETHHGHATTEDSEKQHGHVTTAEPENHHGHMTTEESENHHGHVTTAEPHSHQNNMTTNKDNHNHHPSSEPVAEEFVDLTTMSSNIMPNSTTTTTGATKPLPDTDLQNQINKLEMLMTGMKSEMDFYKQGLKEMETKIEKVEKESKSKLHDMSVKLHTMSSPAVGSSGGLSFRDCEYELKSKRAPMTENVTYTDYSPSPDQFASRIVLGIQCGTNGGSSALIEHRNNIMFPNAYQFRCACRGTDPAFLAQTQDVILERTCEMHIWHCPRY